jgi:hypothetical protein
MLIAMLSTLQGRTLIELLLVIYVSTSKAHENSKKPKALLQ